MTLRKVGETLQPFVEEIERQRHPWLFTLDIEKAKGKGRGHWEHRGRPGKRGGSLPDKLQFAGNISPKAVDAFAGAWDRMPKWATNNVGTVSVHEAVGEGRKIGGKQYNVGGSWDAFSGDGTVTIYDANQYAGKEDDALGMLSHEVGHAVFNKWGVSGDDIYDVQDAHPEWFTKRGQVRAKHKVAVAAAAPFYGSRQKWYAALEQGEDGITSYSKSYKRSPRFLGPETFAEMFKIRVSDGPVILQRRCQRAGALQLHEAFEEMYAAFEGK